MTPKFSVGEVVILQSKDAPAHNGEYTVKHVYNPGEIIPCMGGTDVTYSCGGEFSYSLGFCYEDEGSFCDGWRESALRKKHQPGDMSFTELMVNLSEPVQAPSYS